MNYFALITCGVVLGGTLPGFARQEPTATLKEGVIHFCPGDLRDGVVAPIQVSGKPLWVTATRKGGKTRQITLRSRLGGRGARPSTIKLAYPFGEASATWNIIGKREGDILTFTIPWNASLIGDIMDVNEGEERTDAARRKLGLSDPDSSLPILYLSGDSISLGYWPYLEAELFDTANLYYQRELKKDMPEVKLVNNGLANLAHRVLQQAYGNKNFKPEYWLVNFGLHMIQAYGRNLPGYRKWVQVFIDDAKKKGAKLIFVNTTPYGHSFRPVQNRTIVQFNGIMKELADKNNIPVIDLHALSLDATRKFGEKETYEDGVHFKRPVIKMQAAYIAKRFREIIKNPAYWR